MHKQKMCVYLQLGDKPYIDLATLGQMVQKTQKKRKEKNVREEKKKKNMKRKNNVPKKFGAEFNKVSDYLVTAQFAAVWFRSLTLFLLRFKIQAASSATAVSPTSTSFSTGEKKEFYL